MSEPIHVAILTVSDRCSRGEQTDTAGPAVAQCVRDEIKGHVILTACVPDDQPVIAQTLLEWSRQTPPPDLILTVGGTGLSPRDVTPEATLQVIHRHHPGLMELVRRRGYDATPLAYLSRGEAGVCGQSLIINLPGSPRGATQSFLALTDVLPHAITILQGRDGHNKVDATDS